MQPNKYNVRAADVAQDRDAVLALWNQAFGHRQRSIKYDWCYGQTPQGVGRLYILGYGENDTAIGVQGIVPRSWWFKGKAASVGICADLAVEKNHRSIGPALTLVRRVIELEQRLGSAEMLFGFPNSKSEALYRRAGYTKMGEITRYARPLRLRHWLARKGIPVPVVTLLGAIADLVLRTHVALSSMFLPQQWRCVPVTEFDKRFDELWSRVAPQAGPMVPRNSGYLRWRFCKSFVRQVRVMVLEANDGRIDGYVIYRIGENKMVSIQDFLAVENVRALPAMLNSFVREMYKRGYYGISLEYFGPKPIADALIHAGFSPRECNPIYVVLNESADSLVQGPPPYFTASDRDQ